MGKPRIKLKKTIIAVLKENTDGPLSANELLSRCEKKLSANYIPKSSNAMGQIMRQVKGVSSIDTVLTNERGNSYVSAVYSLDSEEAFNEWLEKVSQ